MGIQLDFLCASIPVCRSSIHNGVSLIYERLTKVKAFLCQAKGLSSSVKTPKDQT